MTSHPPQIDVAIVGAGFAGMYLLHRCRKMGLRAQVWEAGSGVGGTWYWNRYPGARCDIESMQYSYQFDDALQQDWNWTERYAPQPEILAYAEHVAERFGLLDGITFERRVASARYEENAQGWVLTATSGETLRARFCVMATGCLSKPNWPDIAGYEDFDGGLHHTGLWPKEGVDLAGKRVAIIGTGSSAIQTIPRVAEQAAHLTVFQRTPNYSVPARNGPLSADYAADFKARYPQIRAEARKQFGGQYGDFNTRSALDATPAEREAAFEKRWKQGGFALLGAYGDFLESKAANDMLVAFVHRKIRETVKEPKTADLLCPDNIIGGKRMCVDTGYFETYNRDNVDLVDIRTTPIERLTPEGVQVSRQVFPADEIIIATGFDAMTGALTRMDIRGTEDTSLRALWAKGPSSYLGVAMAGFPNLFTVTGPGSPSVLTNMLPTIEQHVEWITECIGYLGERGARRIEALPTAEADWWHHVQEMGRSGIKQTTESWYTGANIAGKARVFMPYLGGNPAFLEKCAEVVAKGYEGFDIR